MSRRVGPKAMHAQMAPNRPIPALRSIPGPFASPVTRVSVEGRKPVGFLSQLVGAVVDAVESATGSENSSAGNAAGQAASAVEQAASNAAEAAAEAAGEAAEFVAMVGASAGNGTTGAIRGWVGGALTDAGIPLPKALDLRGTVNLVVAVGELTAHRIEAKLERIAGPIPVRTGKAAILGFVQEGPRGAFDAVKGVVLDTVDADKRIREWIARTGSVLAETSPAEAADRILAEAPNGPAATWRALQDLLGGRDSTGRRKPGPLTTLAGYADHERRMLLEELRRAAALVEQSLPKGPIITVRVPPPRSTRAPQGIELQRLIPVVAGTPGQAGPQLDPALARLLANATSIALRSAALHARLQLWLAMIARLSRIQALAGKPSREQPKSPLSGHAGLPHTASLIRKSALRRS
ncbi:MAG: hypothetical protein JNL98_07885 [Bryobacterales bacterium]|nr:hypothetical protein [Bryobacterales bacterium]